MSDVCLRIKKKRECFPNTLEKENHIMESKNKLISEKTEYTIL